MKGGYFLFNGRFYKEGDAVFTVSDLTARTSGFIESFRAEHNEVLFRESVSNHLIATANSLEIDLTGLIDDEGKLLQKDVSRLLNKNKLYLAAEINIQIYTSDNQINIILQAEEMERGYYPIGEPGLLLSFYEEQLKETRPDFTYSPFGLYIQNSAKRYASAFNEPNVIIRNSDGFACECIGGSFAFIEGEFVYFVSPGSGGYRCAIREEVIRSVSNAGFTPRDKDQITREDLLGAEEVFLYDACHGIRKVLGLEDQRYFSTKTKVISEKLTSLAKQDRKEKD
jgi:branched-subunit amino acid aminotransferase/4-amino-4-deoxychorismate lyase